MSDGTSPLHPLDLTGEAPEVAVLVRELGLIPLPEEGGLFAETYRSSGIIPGGVVPGRHATPRTFGTAIYYLVTPTRFSTLHRVASTEIFHFYRGGPVRMLQLHPDGSARTVVIGPDVEAGQRPQVVVPRGVWQGTRLLSPEEGGGGRYALLGCTVAPGFEYEDYEHGDRVALSARYPDWTEEIARLSPQP